MSPTVKTLLIFSLTLNLFFSIQYLRSTSTPTNPNSPSDATAETQDPTAAPTPQEESLMTKVFGAGDSELVAQIKHEFFPQVQMALSKRFPEIQPEDVSLTDQEILVMMSKTAGGRVQREAARSMVTSILDTWKAGKPALKDRSSKVQFRDDPPKM